MDLCTIRAMKLANHPQSNEIRLENVMSALSNPLRLATVRMIAEGGSTHAVQFYLRWENQQ
ncbi:hypothetical protein KY207_003240 [Providencia stuartii]